MCKENKEVPIDTIEKELQRQDEEKVLKIWGVTSIIFSIEIILLCVCINENIEIIIKQYPQIKTMCFKSFYVILAIILFINCILYWKRIFFVHKHFYVDS